MSAVADVLNGAADLIERDGWVQGRNRSSNGRRRCAWGAICDAGYPAAESRTVLDAAGLVESTLGGRFLTHWNDEPGRTKAEVVAALRAAAERAA